MPIEVGIWRVDDGLKAIEYKAIDEEAELQEIVANDISIVDPDLMVIGREVAFGVAGRVDVLAIDADGNLSVIELKRGLTPRDVIAQILDYGSWVRRLTEEDIAEKFVDYQKRFLDLPSPKSIDAALLERFDRTPDSLNSAHRLIIVAGNLDPSTERIVAYLAEEYGVEINVVYFRVFEDDERQYLSRAWLREPSSQSDETVSRIGVRGEWNGEFYVSFGIGAHRAWPDAKKHGFISAGGGERYVSPLRMLQPGNRVWVNVPGTGYVGVGEVLSQAVRFDEFHVSEQGVETPIVQLKVEAPNMFDDVYGQHFVGVRWIKAVELDEAAKETGFFGNQNTVARPRDPKWQYTVDRLKTLWKVS